MDCTQDRSFLTKARLLATLFFISIFLFSSRSVHARAIEDIDAVPQAEDDQTTPEGPTSTKNFQLDTWKYQRKFDFSSSETQGPWKYGVPLTYDSSLFRGKNVYVHVIPWTHVDPGYKSSYTNSFNVHIGKILTSVVNALSAKPSRRFIWPETCILQRWYANANDAMKEALKKVIANGQLEIVTGGWIMADESLSHYETMLEELTEGHDWLIRALGVRPTVGFSVDAIGHSPVMSYILKKSGIKGTVINKIHYAYKKELAKNRALEFMWAPAWSNSQDDRLFTHVHPFANCDVAHSCGPDPEVCSMYDFTNIGKKTHWGKTVNAVTSKAIAGMAEALVDQYKQQAMLFRTNHIPVFLGGPSYYELLGDLGTQLDSYQSLFDYINKNPQYNVRIAFSNLSSWFSAVSRSKFYPKRKR